MASARLSEQRARSVTRELLGFRGWDLRPVSSGGQLLEESEYLSYPSLANMFGHSSKKGKGFGKPDFLLVRSPENLSPLIVIDTKPKAQDIGKSIEDTNHYGNASVAAGHDVLSVAVAGAEKEICEVRVQRKIEKSWEFLTLNNTPIDWIPSPQQSVKILSHKKLTEVSPERPSDKALAENANRFNEILRECNIKDEFRPVYAATFMLALWFNDVSVDPSVVLGQINVNASTALRSANKPDLAESLRVDPKNDDLANKSWEIIDILKKLNIRSFLQEHDYLGQLYETFFRYTGGNTIGQYFTPRHIVDFMCDMVGINPNDTVFDPACGTGGFLIGSLNRMIRLERLKYEEAIDKVRNNIFGMEIEPTTAALCVANMILRGDGKSGVIHANCFKDLVHPEKLVDRALLNPPFPHKKKTQKPASAFIDRALHSVRERGLVAAIVPYSLLANVKEWHEGILKHNRLVFAATLPADVFNPYSNYDTAIVIIEKGVPHGRSRVFFARIDNDGFRLKKAMRIPRPGSQLDSLLDAFDRKIEVPEFTAYRTVTLDTGEWSPETFIESAPHDDENFINGFEESVRKQSSFYIRYGYKLLGKNNLSGIGDASSVFSNKSRISLKGMSLAKFNVRDYFDVTLGGKDEIEDLEEGNDPFVSTSEWDNGVSNWKRANVLFSPNSITVAADGSAYASYVQEFPFYAFYKVAILKPKKGIEINEDALYYVSYLLNKEGWRFVRARKYGKARILDTVLFAPSKNDLPDFESMANLTRRTIAFPIVQSFRDAYRQSPSYIFYHYSEIWKKKQRLCQISYL